VNHASNVFISGLSPDIKVFSAAATPEEKKKKTN